MGKLLFCFWSFAAFALFRVWGMTNGLNVDSKSIDPMAVNIDRKAFMEQYSADEADVIKFLDEINKANKIGNGVQLIGESFISAPKKRCEDGPIQVVHQVDPKEIIIPVPLKGICNGLYCKDYECLAREKKKVCRWGLHYTTKQTTEGELVSVFLGIKRVCYETHLRCGCKTCANFKTPKECNNVTSCPNSKLSTVFQTNCYWVYPIIKLETFPTVSFKRMITVPFRGRCSCCIPKSCIPPFIFNRATCKCECPPRPKCNESQFYNPDKCQCECKKIVDCEDGHEWNNKTCSCDCDLSQECLSPKTLDPKTCQCKCPNGSIEDTKTGNCTGNCERFHESDNCEKILCEEDPTKLCVLINRRCDCPKNMTLCEEISDPGKCNQTVCPGTNLSPSIMCKFYHYVNPSTNRSGCQCDDNKISDGCCIRKPSAPLGTTDCSIFNTFGSKQCNSVRGCEWVCHCKNITDAKVCINSTCLAQPNLTCRYSSTVGCDCPSCCKDHPNNNNVFDCASLHMLGSRRCNRAIDSQTCQWRCECNDIDNAETCLLSTCANNPRKRCKFDESCFC